MESPRPLPTLSDDLLEEIFLRIGSPADLVRASAACKAFRRLIADPSVLRRYRSLHPPLLLGFVYRDGCGLQPAEAPHPSAALARAVARVADFSFDGYFPLGTGASWNVWDVRDGRVLLRCVHEDAEESAPMSFLRFPLDLAVCDPLARRCLVLPPIPDDLLASVQFQKQNIRSYHSFLAPCRDEDNDASFRVIARMFCKEMVVAFIFSSAAGHWSVGTSVRWDSLSMPRNNCGVVWPNSYAYGCFYWKFLDGNKWLKFDTSSVEFSAVYLPSVGCGEGYTIIVEAGEGKLGVFNLINNRTTLCYYIIRQIGGDSFDQLKMDNIIPLPAGYWYHIYSPHEGHLFISRYQSPQFYHGPDAWFALEIKTLKIERVCQMRTSNAKPYFGFPPFMSPRRV